MCRRLPSDWRTVDGTDEDKRKAFVQAFAQLRKRIDLFTHLPFEKLDRLAMQQAMQNIGTSVREKGE
jgi:hypothetical protein